MVILVLPEPNTRVLSDDERRDFDGVTIEEVGDSVHVDSTPTYMDEERQRYEQYNQYRPQVKVYSFNSTSWLVASFDYHFSRCISGSSFLWRHHPIRSRCCHFSGCYCFLYLWPFNGIIHIL